MRGDVATCERVSVDSNNNVAHAFFSAEQYDMLLQYNPFYQQLHREVLEVLQSWKVPSGATLADIGAGTGNYSLAIANLFPQATILHFDNDPGMNAAAIAKRPVSLTNHHVYQSSVDAIQIARENLDGLISIHALYTFPDPKAALQNMFQWLKPGAPAILVNAGRSVNVLSWQLAIGLHLIRNYGFRKTMEILQQGKEVSRQNAYIRKMQDRGIYWTHSHQEFCEAVSQSGFEILSAKKAFRGISDQVIARKPLA